MTRSFLTGKQPAPGGRPDRYPEDESFFSTSETAGPPPSGAGPSGADDQPRQSALVRAVLAEHPGKVFVLPGSRRIPVDTLLEHLAEPGNDSQWADVACEVHFVETLDPWAAPSSAPCWQGMRGPLFHLWTAGEAGDLGKLIGLIIPDQRGAGRAGDIGRLLKQEEAAPAREPEDAAAVAPACEIELSDLVVEGEYHPRMAETDAAILALSPPEGEGWQPRWWKLGTRPLWQYGWSRWK